MPVGVPQGGGDGVEDLPMTAEGVWCSEADIWSHIPNMARIRTLPITSHSEVQVEKLQAWSKSASSSVLGCSLDLN